MKLIYKTIIECMVFFISAVQLNAQMYLSVNIGSQPVWGPVGYESVQYYYLPDMDAYYNVPQRLFYFNEGSGWKGRLMLPERFRDYDLYRTYKVVINEREPWRQHETYRVKYLQHKGRHDQDVIRDSRDKKYFVNKNHPEHNNWVKQQNNRKHKENDNKGNGKGNKKNNSKGNGNKKK